MLKTLRLSKPYGTVAFRDVGAGPPLVLIHGVGMQSAAWMPQVDHFASAYRVIAVDMPGHGNSDALVSHPTLPDFVAWLHAVLVALDIKSVSLAGHSMGALISAGFAISHPEYVTRVALLNGVFQRTDKARLAVQQRASQIRNGVFDVSAHLQRWFDDRDTDIPARKLVTEWLENVQDKGYADAYTAFAGGDYTYADKFSCIQCPFLALTGAGDPNSTPEMSEKMASLVQHGRAVTIENERHMVNMTAPNKVNKVLGEWLQTL